MHRRTAFTVALSFLIPIGLMAAPAEEARSAREAARLSSIVEAVHIAPVAVPGPALTRQQVLDAPLSGAPYFDLLKAHGLDREVPRPQNTAKDVSSLVETFTQQGRFRFGTDSIATVDLPTKDISQNLDADIEPSVVAVNKSGTDYTAFTYITYDTVGGVITPRNHYARTTGSFSTFNRGLLPIPAGYTHSADPINAVNNTASAPGAGRIYCAGIIYNAGMGNAANGIAVWRSDNGGSTWAGPAVIATSAGGGHFLDKPAIAVSLHAGSIGYVYVAWMDVDVASPVNSSLHVSRSIDGGITFPQDRILTFDFVQGPQVAVSTSDGTVHAAWMNDTFDDIRYTKSVDFGNTFGAHEVISSGQVLRTAGNGNRNINGGLRAGTLPIMRWNNTVGKVAVVWHADTPTVNSYLSFKPCSSSCNASGWRNAVRVNTDVTTTDQFMPAVSANNAGNWIVTFYDRRDDPANQLYHVYYALAVPTGTITENGKITTTTTDPSATLFNFIGDYQDVYVHNYGGTYRAAAAWAQAATFTTYLDIYGTKITWP